MARVGQEGLEASTRVQAIEQLTISGLSRHGQPELENHLRLEAPMAWQDVQTQVEKYLSTICHVQCHHHQWTSARRRQVKNARAAEARLTRAVSVGTETRRVRHVANDDTRRKFAGAANAQQPRTTSPNIVRKGTGKGFTGKGKSKDKKRPPETCLYCGKERTQEGRMQDQKHVMGNLWKGRSLESDVSKYGYT